MEALLVVVIVPHQIITNKRRLRKPQLRKSSNKHKFDSSTRQPSESFSIEEEDDDADLSYIDSHFSSTFADSKKSKNTSNEKRGSPDSLHWVR